jgi:hypothetical protein
MYKIIGVLNESDFIHPDVKLENIFITNDNNFKLGKIFSNVYSIFSFFI